ncbi:MAG: hypothetical protein AAF798_19010 [Bacteroidota bacterium]
MKLNTPITTVVKKMVDGNQLSYFLHAVTLIDSNIYKTSGYQINHTGGAVNVDLFIEVDSTIQPLGVISPIVHNVELGALPGDGTKINIEVKFNERLVGKASTQDDHAEEDDKPRPPFI